VSHLYQIIAFIPGYAIVSSMVYRIYMFCFLWIRFFLCINLSILVIFKYVVQLFMLFMKRQYNDCPRACYQEEHLRKLHKIEMTNAPSMYKVIPWAAPLKFIPLSNLNIIWLGRRRTWNLEYMYHRWPRICSTCRNYFPVLSSFMAYQRVCN
jgi:hypothetical protein